MRDAPKIAACYCYSILVVLFNSLHLADGLAVPAKTSPLEPLCLYREIPISPSITSNDDTDGEDSGAVSITTPQQLVSVQDLTPTIEALLEESGIDQGTVTVISRHTTTAITINELESRLQRDITHTFLQLIPPDERSAARQRQSGVRYEHNDIDQRPESAAEAERCRLNGWNVATDAAALQAWRAQEPINAHAHLLSMMLGSSEAIPIVDGSMVIGQWQSVLLVDWDGPRERTVGVQVMGFR